MTRIIVAGVLGGIIVFIWGAVSWMVLPWHTNSLNSFEDPDATFAAIADKLPGAGVYHFPGYPPDGTPADEQAKWFDQYKGGGSINLLVYNDTGLDPFASTQFIRGFVLNVLSAIVAAYLLSLAVGPLRAYGSRVFFVLMLGVFASLVGPVTDWNWWQYPAGFTTVMLADLVISWLLAGAIIAAIVKPVPVANA